MDDNIANRLLEVFKLPYTTAECDVGPIAEHRPSRLTLRYDAEDEAGVVWTVLSFTGVFAARFTSAPACPAWVIRSYSRVCQVVDSSWILELRGAVAASGEGQVSASARHFVLYFDHVGCWEVVARDVELEP